MRPVTKYALTAVAVWVVAATVSVWAGDVPWWKAALATVGIGSGVFSFAMLRLQWSQAEQDWKNRRSR